MLASSFVRMFIICAFITYSQPQIFKKKDTTISNDTLQDLKSVLGIEPINAARYKTVSLNSGVTCSGIDYELVTTVGNYPNDFIIDANTPSLGQLHFRCETSCDTSIKRNLSSVPVSNDSIALWKGFHISNQHPEATYIFTILSDDL